MPSRRRRRTIGIGDVHGCSLALDALIAAVDPGPDDTVVALGDYVDRGPDTRGVLESLIALGGRCRLVPLLGNHEQMLLEARDDLRSQFGPPGHRLACWLGVGGRATLDSYGEEAGLDMIPDAHLAFLASCRDVFETETHFFVHASYDPDLPLAGQPLDLLRWQSLRDAVPGPHASGKAAVVGHTSQKSGEVLGLGHLTCIDTYCHGGGWLTALDVDRGRVWQVNRKGEKRRAAR